MQKIILFFLAFFARNIIKFHQPYVIGITWTVWKSTITWHVHAYLAHEFGAKNVAYSPYHYNGEYWLPLTIIGAKTGGKNPFLWLFIFVRALVRPFFRYPKYLVLEYGIDHPGEMDFLLSIVVPDIAVITEIIPNHIEQFGTFDSYRKEKFKITQRAKDLIIHDSGRPFIWREALYYGRGAMSDINTSHIEVTEKWTNAIVHSDHHDYRLSLPVFWEFQIENLLPLYAIANILSTDANNIASYAKNFSPESWRSGILTGIWWATIIDGSYNGGYLSLHSGISSLRSFLHSHRLVFLIGDMRELWSETQSMHEQLADEILTFFPKGSDVSFFLVGPSMKEYVAPRIQNMFSTKSYLSSQKAGHEIQKILQKDKDRKTMIYVKGSQNTIFLEEGIKEFLASKSDISKLCRQSKEWMRKKNIFFESLED